MSQVQLMKLPKPEWIGRMSISKIESGYYEMEIYDVDDCKIDFYGLGEVRSLEIGRWLSSCMFDLSNSTFAAEIKTYNQLKTGLPGIDWDCIDLEKLCHLSKKIYQNRPAPSPLLTYEDHQAVTMPHNLPTSHTHKE